MPGRAHDGGRQEVVMGCLNYTVYTRENPREKNGVLL